MNQEELRALVAELLREMEPTSAPQQSAGENNNHHEELAEPELALPDITKVDLRREYLTQQPAQPERFQALRRRTPARLGVGRAGTRYLTQTLLRFRADHAAAQDSVFSELPKDFARANGWIPIKTRCGDKDEYLTRPDLGRRFDEAAAKVIQEVCAEARVLLVIGDGLSSAAITANAADCAAAIRQGLQRSGIEPPQSLCVQYCRVGASDHIGELTGCELVCLLIGERPGLATSQSMSAYLTYRPHCGIAESSRSVVSNIHAQGVPAVEAGAHIAGLIARILRQKVSGVALKTEEE